MNLKPSDPISSSMEVPAAFSPSLNSQLTTSGSEKRSSLAKIESKKSPASPYIPSKPTLERPKNPIPTLLGFVQKWDTIGHGLAQLNQMRIEKDTAHIEKLKLDENRKMDEALALSKQVGFWGILEDLSNMITGGISTVLGYNLLVTTSPITGGILITAGVLSISNMVLKQTEGWDWISDKLSQGNEDLANQIRLYLPAAFGITSTVLGVVGTASAWYFGGLSQADQILTILQTATNLVEATSTIGSAVHGSQKSWTEAEISFLHSMQRLFKIHVEDAMDEMKSFCEQQTQIIGFAEQILRSTRGAIQVTNQAV